MIKKYSFIITYQGSEVLKRYKELLIIAVVLILLNNIQVVAQVSQKEMIETQFDNYRQNNLQEKIFVHTDKGNYVTGEICWFKIYNVDAYFHTPINIGKVAYVEILDKDNKAVLQANIAMDSMGGDGSFYIPPTIVSGNYKLRAYTNWMKNYGTDYFFEKKLVIINVQKIQPKNAVAQKALYEISFFPEGGNLVNGIKSKVGFKFVNQFGKGIYGEGVLLNEKGDTITNFHPLKFGIGNFTFTPLAGSVYKAIVNLSGGGQQTKQLPVAYKNGYVMHLENTGKGQIKITVQTTDKNNTSNAAIYLFVHTRNVVKAVMSSNLEYGEAVFFVDDLKPGEGISHFTIFNDNKQPVCERLFFKKPIKSLQIQAGTDEPLYGMRKKININVRSATEQGKPVAANMSIAVYRVDSFTTIDEQYINNYLLLDADLSGPVESSDYYFKENNDTATTAMDNLMLTQGWRRFKWEDILSNKKSTFQFLPEIKGHIISGKITALKPGTPVKDIQAYLSVPGIRAQFQTAEADENGKVKFEMKDFYNEKGEIIVQTNNELDSLYHIDIEQPFFSRYAKSNLSDVDFYEQNPALLKMYIASQVQNIFLYSKLNQSWTPPLDTTSFYLKPDAVYLLDNYVRFTTLEEVLREYVLEVNVRKRNGHFLLPMYDEIAKTISNYSPLVLLDGLPVFDFNKLMTFDPLKIRKLEVMSRKYYFGGNSFDGIVNFSTYKGDMAGFKIDPRATVVDYEGLQLQREFYAPVYATEANLQSRIPDFRNLLFWSPKLITNSNGKQQSSFYTSDVPGTYAIVVQGISEDGRAGAKVVFFDVKK